MRSFIKTSLLQKGGRILLGSFMVAVAIGHLTNKRKEFQAQVPDSLPADKDVVVLGSGLAELSLGLSMLFWKSERARVGAALALFYAAIFPGNIAQYIYQRDAFGLDTDEKRFARLFFQPVLIAWALWSTGAGRALLEKQHTTAPKEDQ